MNMNELLNPIFLENLINMAANMDRSSIPAKQLKAIQDLTDATEKIYKAQKELYPQYRMLALGNCLLKYRECQAKDMMEQGGQF